MQNANEKVPCNRRILASAKTSEMFGVCDAKGREIGAMAHSSTEEFAANGKTSGYSSVPGVYYFGHVHMIRGNAEFGASHGDRRFDTAAERDDYLVKQMAVSRKNALKKYAA